MNHFGLSRSRRCDVDNNAISPKSLELGKVVNCPVIFEGAEALDAVCPVSSLTGNRMSIYEAMQMLGNEKYSRAIDQLLPEIPAIMSDSRLSDDDRVDLMTSRLNTGSSSEDSRLRDDLAKIVSDFKDSFKTVQESKAAESSVNVQSDVQTNE